MSFILVTGASGFIASHVIDQLLAAGHNVRGTVRSTKAETIRTAYASYGDKFEVAVVDDIATSDLSEAFKDVKALMHVASAMDPSAGNEVILKTTITGTNRVLAQALASNVKKIIFTASIASVIDIQYSWSDKSFGAKDWNPITLEDAFKPDTSVLVVYMGSKKAAEENVWKFAKEHPDFDVATVIPPYVYGPATVAQSKLLTTPAAGTNRYIYELIKGTPGTPRPLPAATMLPAPPCVHVSDVARAHVLLLDAPPSASNEPKRVVLSGVDLVWKDAVEYLGKTRPELKRRLFEVSSPEAAGSEERQLKWYKLDGSSAERIIGMKTYKSWESIIDETIDDVLEREKELSV